jgi:hypothetical protein
MSKGKRKAQKSKKARAEEKALRWIAGAGRRVRHLTSHASGRNRLKKFKYAKDDWHGDHV